MKPPRDDASPKVDSLRVDGGSGVARHQRRLRTVGLKRCIAGRVVGQFHQPRGVGGRLVGWVMANHSSNRRRNARVVSLLEVVPTDSVLEIGFGPGIAIRESATRASGGRIAITSQPRGPGVTEKTTTKVGEEIASLSSTPGAPASGSRPWRSSHP